jgi:hypothetical protein
MDVAGMITGETTETLRRDIDSGRTGDKVAASDPAAVPLGADYEAAGKPPRSDEIAQARLNETARPHEKRERHGLGHAWILVAFTVLLATAIVVWAAAIRGNPSTAGVAMPGIVTTG